MTIDEGIKKLLDEAEQQDKWADNYVRMDYYSEATPPEVRRQRAKECRQLAEWLTDYKELNNSIGAVKLKDMKEAVRLLQELNTENDQLTSQLTVTKRLLKLAVEDMNSNNICFDINACNVCAEKNCISCDTFHWRYTDEALKLIES